MMLKSIQFYKASVPILSEVFQRSPWVFYGDNNLYPQFLIQKYDNCAIHKAVVTSKKEQVCGDGIVSLNNPMATINLINPSENVAEVYAKCALDLILFGGYALNVVWSRDRKSIAEIYHVDFSRVRTGKINPETDEIDYYYYSADWGNIKKFKPEEYCKFGQDEHGASQIYYYKSYQPSNSYYPSPDYSGGLSAIDIDIEFKNFHKNNLQSGMRPSLWVNFANGVPGEEEQRIITRALEEQYGGTDNAGRAIISFNESKEQSPEITQIAAGTNDSYYESLYEDIVRSILSAHRVSNAELFGIATAGKLGSRTEIVDHSEYFRKMVIIPYQHQLLGSFNKLVSLKFGKPTTFEVKPLTIFLPEVTTKEVPVNVEASSEAPMINENIKGLKGREYQSLMRIVREYNKEKITREQAIQMLMSGYGLTKEECNVWLGEEE
jgi:hypothetical protein